MRLKDTLQNIMTMLETSSIETKKLKEEVAEIKTKINGQQVCTSSFSQKLEDINEINVGSATLIEELVHYIMDDTTNNNDIIKKQNAGPTRLYLVQNK